MIEFTKSQLLSAVRKANDTRIREADAAEKKYRDTLTALLREYAEANAAFRPGDVIKTSTGNRFFDITRVRIESVDARLDGNDVYIVYRGEDLNPDWTHRKSSANYESIYDNGYGNVVKLDAPEYDGFIVESEERSCTVRTWPDALERTRAYSGGGQHEVDILGRRTSDGEPENVYHLPASFRRQ